MRTIIAGQDVVDGMDATRAAMIERKELGYDSQTLLALQIEEARRGILGVELVRSIYGWTVRYDSGLQDFGIVAGCRRGDRLDGTFEDAERYATEWVARDPERRYAWVRVGARECTW